MTPLYILKVYSNTSVSTRRLKFQDIFVLDTVVDGIITVFYYFGKRYRYSPVHNHTQQTTYLITVR